MVRRGLLALALLAGCPPGEGSTGTGSSGEATTGAATSGGATSGPTTSGPTTGGPSHDCAVGGIGDAFAWATPPGPGTAACIRISDGSLALDCTGDFTGIFTLMLASSGTLGIVVGDPLEVDVRRTDAGEWLRVRGQNQWYVVAGQGPTVAPPDAPADWFHPNVAVAPVPAVCAPVDCGDGSGDAQVPRALAFGQGEQVAVYAAGESGGVPGEFGGERYHAVVTEATTGVCGGDAAAEHFAFSVVSSGLE